jgi:hypothetical protein
LIQSYQHLFKKDAEIAHNVDQLVEKVKVLESARKNNNNWSTKAEAVYNPQGFIPTYSAFFHHFTSAPAATKICAFPSQAHLQASQWQD